ncbi:MAG: hypothetical protein J3K34DRAFT_523627 [Monoraphidium minutum]|nr:MAG: hypothetical protein J3K34DRAFT_523627 [Monoraphidium minutum]
MTPARATRAAGAARRARRRPRAAAAALAALLSLLLAAPGAQAVQCTATIQSTLNCIDCFGGNTGYCLECKADYQLTYTTATSSVCTTPLPLGPANLGCYSTTSGWATALDEVVPGNAQPTRARCRSLAAAHSYTYFGMTGTSGSNGKCFMSNSTPEALAPGACTYSCPNTSPVEPCGGPKSGTTEYFSVYATAVPGGTCEGGWYDDSNVCTSCQVAECNTNCDVCSSGSAGACTECASGWALISGSCDGQCSDTTNCDACSSTVDGGCTKCKNGKVLDNGKCVGTCSTGKWNNNGKCDPCSNNCTSCSSASTCSACATGYKVVSGVCQVSCSDTNCEVCTNNGANSCTKCKNGKVMDDGECVDTCSPGKWKNGDKCDPCKDNCKSCSSGDTCDVCKDNYWVDNGDCGNCRSNCKACPSASSCTTCADGYEFSGTECVLSQGGFRVVCNPGTYSSNGSGVCAKCSNHCKTCTSNTTCDVCKTGYRLINNKCYVDLDPSAAAVGDPHLMGFGGQSYSFCEHTDGAHCLGRTFSMLSAPAYALNAHITRMAGPDAWPHAGACRMTGLGFRFGGIPSVTLEMATDVEYKVVPDGRGEDTTRAILPKDWSKVFASMRVNGRNVLGLIGAGNTLLHGVAGEASVHFPDRRHKGDETDGTVAVITTPGMRIKLFLESEDVTHLDFEITLFSSAINTANTHGLLGQSLAWAPGVPAAIEGHELDWYCLECKAGYQLTYTTATSSVCTTPLPLGPDYLGCYNTYNYFGMTGTSGTSGKCVMSNTSLVTLAAPGTCTFPCPSTTPTEPCGGTSVGSFDFYSVYATAAAGGTCEGGWYDGNNGRIPPPCSSGNCDVCTNGTAGACTKCKNTWALVSGSCDTRCSDADCDVCTDNGANSCTQCKTGKVLDGGKCEFSTCPTGKWNNNNKCDPCGTGCKNCTSISSCSNCQDNYYDDAGTCKNCPANCKACTSSDPGSCSACDSGYALEGGSCANQCNDPQCEECSNANANSCNKCKPGKVLNEGKCANDTCPVGKWNNNGKCDPCKANCKSCTTGTDCQQCNDNFWYNVNTCDNCANNCKVCTDSTNAGCSECIAGYEQVAGGMTGDPHLKGFGGQSYAFCEILDGVHCLGRTFSMLSAPAYALNAHIARMAGPDKWPFAGAWMTGLGFRYGDILSVDLTMATDVVYKVVPDGRGVGTTRAVLPEDWSDVFESMHINGKDEMENLIGTGETLLFGMAGEVSVSFPFKRHDGDETDGTVAIIMTPGMRIKLFLESEDVTHLDFDISLFSSAINAANTHGLLGQSLAWGPGVPAAIEGHELEYVVQGGLLGTDFKFSRFEDNVGAADASAGAETAARRMLGKQPAVRRGGSRLS